MNVHGRTALAWWSTNLPVSFSGIEKPQEFFTHLGEQVEAEIEDRNLLYAGADPLEETAEEKTARLQQALTRATDEVYAELVTPSPDSQGEPYADLEQPAQTG
jgi:hypothetical protein